jgi:hypothetical protein
MSSETAKKRGRPKKTAILQEEFLVLEQPSKTKPRKSTTKKPCIEDAHELFKSTKESIKNTETPAKPQSPVDSRANGRNGGSKKLPNNDGANQKALSSAESTILQKANAFKTVTESPTSAQRQVSGLREPDQTTIGKSISVSGVEWNATAANAPELIEEQQPTIDSVEDISGAWVQEARSRPPTSGAAATIIDTETDAIDRPLDPESAAPMSSGPPASTPSDKGPPALDSTKPITTPFTSPKSDFPATVRPKISTKPGPRLPASFAPPPAPPPPPRPTQLPYHELKRNPEFKALSRKYTSLIIAIPIALFTSYVLWGRCKFWLDLDSLTQSLKKNSQIPIRRLDGV